MFVHFGAKDGDGHSFFPNLPQCLALHKVAYASLRSFAFASLRAAMMSILILQFCSLDRRVHQNSIRYGSLSRRHFLSMHNTPKRRPHLPLPFCNVDLDVAEKVAATLHVGILANEIAS